MSNFVEYFNAFDKVNGSFYSDKNKEKYEKIVAILDSVRSLKGRVFIIGMGGSAANAQHLANDMRKMNHIDAIALSDNIAELTARANDDGFETIFSNMLKVSNLRYNDAVFVLSVSGGSVVKNASMILVNAMDLAAEREVPIIGIVGMEESVAGVYSNSLKNSIIVTPEVPKYQTQFAEALQSVIWHGIISDPVLMKVPAKW